MPSFNKYTNRALKPTEQSSYYKNLASMTVTEILEAMNSEDAKIHLAVNQSIPQINAFINQLIENILNGGRLFYVGSGTSGRLGILDASEIPPTFGIEKGLIIGIIAGGDLAIKQAVENAEDDTNQAWEDIKPYNVNPIDTILGLAASGSTPYVLGALKSANSFGCTTGCITCNPDTSMAQISQFPIEVFTGPEFVTGSTRLKAATAQKMVLNMISTTTMVKLGRVRGNKMVNMQLTNQKLIERAVRILKDELNIEPTEAKELLKQFGSVNNVLNSFKNQ